MNICIVCNSLIENVQYSIECDKCNRWCHTRCGTGISDIRYQYILQGGFISWVCIPCRENENRRVARDYGPSQLIQDIQEDHVVTIETPPSIIYNDTPNYTIINNGTSSNGVSMITLVYL